MKIKMIMLDRGISEATAAFAGGYGKRLFLIADEYTFRVCGERIEKDLASRGFTLKRHVFKPEGMLIPDEAALGRLLVELDPDTDLIVAAGSGTLNDLSRMLSFKTRIPYMIIGTAPSMDGYASTVSPLIIDKFKVTYNAVYPAAIMADTEVLRLAPMKMICAGLGDIVGKYTALCDWTLARELEGEYYCETAARLVENAVKICVQNAEKISGRDENAIRDIMSALILSGVAMGLVGNSRPASGAEHHLSHFWEIDAIKHGREHPLHGNSVGVGTVISASVYELLKDRLPAACRPPKPEDIAAILAKAGAANNPRDLGISRELFQESVLNAMHVRSRFTILSYASRLGRLEEIAGILTRRFYDG